MADQKQNKNLNRRDFIKKGVGTAVGISLAGVAGALSINSTSEELVWQLDPNKCVQCEKCSSECVLQESAVKCVHSYSMCGYCDLCSGYLQPGAKSRDTGAESQLCPTGAIKRTYVEDPYFEYVIDEELCIGCSKCVKGCGAFGNGSMYLQVKHDRCVNCNVCRISLVCSSQAFTRVPASRPYILRGDEIQTQLGES